MLNLDTHILILALAGNLRHAEEATLKGQPWGISAIVLWEICKLKELGRISLDLEGRKFQRVVRSLTVWPLTWDIAVQSTKLDIHSDPADEIIGATSIVHHVPLVTRDKRLRKSKLYVVKPSRPESARI